MTALLPESTAIPAATVADVVAADPNVRTERAERLALMAERRRAERSKELIDLQPSRTKRRQVVAVEMRVRPHERPRAVGIDVRRLASEVDHRGVDVGEDHPAAGPHGASELGDRRCEVGAVIEREAADGEVEPAVVDGQRLEAAVEERRLGNLLPGAGEHLR